MIHILYCQCSQRDEVESFGYLTSEIVAEGWVADNKKMNPSWSFWYKSVLPYSGTYLRK